MKSHRKLPKGKPIGLKKLSFRLEHRLGTSSYKKKLTGEVEVPCAVKKAGSKTRSLTSWFEVVKLIKKKLESEHREPSKSQVARHPRKQRLRERDLILTQKFNHFRASNADGSGLRLLLSGDVETNPGPKGGECEQCDHHLQVTTYNVRGLGDEKKVRHLINLIYKTGMKKNSDQIFCLQETYITKPGKIPYLWRGNFHLTPGTGNGQGCVTLLSPHLNVIEASEVEGRAHVLAVQRTPDTQTTYIVANIYAPTLNNFNKLEFFEKVLDKVSEFSERHNCETIIIPGDFNLVFRAAETKNRFFSNQEKRIANFVKDFANSINLADIWDVNEHKTPFTWRRPNTDCFSTIDRIMYSKNYLTLESATVNWSYSFSDHAAVKACFNKKDISQNVRSRIVRLDPSLAKSNIYGPIIIQEYNSLIETIPTGWNPHQKLEFAKVCIRSVVEKVQADRKRKEITEEESLNSELEISINKLAQGDSRDPNMLIEHIEDLRARKATLIEEKGARLAEKLGTKWYNEGEKSSRYFMRLLNRTSPDKFEGILKEDGNLVTDDKLIEEEILSFYKKLYEDKKEVDNRDANFFDQVDPLADEEDVWTTEKITIEAVRETLHTCKDSCPGPDGIPYSYIGLLWVSFGKLLVEAWNYSLEVKELPPSHKASFLKLIPKAGKDLKKLTNWRPITLSNCDHKLITKTYARRLSEKIAAKIGERQTAYLKGRLINDNIRGVTSIIDLLNREGGTGLIVALDAKKAFDSVDHGYIEKCLVKFGCSRFVPIFRTLYKNLNTDIIINGRITPGFAVNRGVKQGDPLSCVLFIMCIEPLLKNIESNPGIAPCQSVNLNCELPKAFAYADDVNCVMEDSETSLRNLFLEYERLTKISGLELNADKTELMKIGSEVESSYTVNYQNSRYELNTLNKIKMNGIFLQRGTDEMAEANVEAVMEKMNAHFKSWSRRSLSLLGKILIVKTFGISQVIYLLQSMTLKDIHFKRINALLYKFIWNRHFLSAKAPDRIKRTILTTPISLGGFGMLDIVELDDSLKLRALGRILTSAHPFNRIVRHQLDLSSFFNPHSSLPSDSVSYKAIELLRKDREKLWLDDKLNSDKNLIAAIGEINLKEVVTTRGQTSIAFFMAWTRGARKVRELSDQELTRLERHIRQDLIPKIKIAIRLNLPAPDDSFLKQYYIARSYKPLYKLSSKEIRESRKDKTPITKFKIGLDLNPKDSLTWCLRIKGLTSTSHKNTVLKVAHGDIYTQEKLNRFGLADSSKCPRCDQIETLKHKVIECQYAARIWTEVDTLSTKLGSPVDPNLDPVTRILGAGKNENLSTLTLKAEIMFIILRLQPDQNYLIHPKKLVIETARRLIIKEQNRKIKNSFIEALRED